MSTTQEEVVPTKWDPSQEEWVHGSGEKCQQWAKQGLGLQEPGNGAYHKEKEFQDKILVLGEREASKEGRDSGQGEPDRDLQFSNWRPVRFLN